MAETWCSSCHALPAPDLLDRATWMDFVLPDMGRRLGFELFRGEKRRPDPNAPLGVYAPDPLMPQADWDRIVDYYEAAAPETLPVPEWEARTPLNMFSVERPERDPEEFPTATAVFIDEGAQRVLVGDSYELAVESYDAGLELVSKIGSGGAVSRIRRGPDDMYLATTMGENIGQTEDLTGLLIGFPTDPDAQRPENVQRLARRLHRPVDMASGDFNGDGIDDYVTAGFGTHFGGVKLHLGQADGGFAVRELTGEAGATALSVMGDDLYVLMAQGNERIERFRDFAGERPRVETVLQFPPAYGSSNMMVKDVTGDGVTDILYTAGDNADITTIFKPYHGIYLFAGQADGTFVEEFFFHQDGTYAAVAEDFDLDGDVDIAATSFFPNLEQGGDAAGFVYLEQTGDGFVPKSLEALGPLGRFVAISAGDVDGDGDKDIALSNMAFGPLGPMAVEPALQRQWIGGTPFVLLRNGTR